MTRYLHAKVGGLQYPIREHHLDSNRSLATLDPVNRRLLAWFQAAVNAELGEAWTSLANELPETHQLYESTPLRYVYPFRPRALELQAGCPALFLYRTESNTEQRTLTAKCKVQQWEAHYLLGKMDMGQAAKFEAALWMVPDIIQTTIETGYHPEYDSGAIQAGTDKTDLISLELKSAKSGQAAFGGQDDAFFATFMTFESREWLGYAEGLEADYTELGMDVGVGGPDGIDPARVTVVAGTSG